MARGPLGPGSEEASLGRSGGTRGLKQRSRGSQVCSAEMVPSDHLTTFALRSCWLPSVPTIPDTHMPPMVTVAQVRSEKAGTVSVAPLAGRM